MNLYFYTFFLVALTFVAIKAELDEACIDVDKNPGTCINLKQCIKLLKLIVESSMPGGDHPGAVKILQQSTCGFVKEDPYVCCPQGKPDSQDGSTSHNSQQSPPLSPENSQTTTVASDFFTRTVTVSTPTPAPTSSSVPIITENKITQAPTSSEEASNEETSISEGEDSTEYDNEKLKLLPEDCGRVITFKYFYGNRTDIDDFPWTTLIEYDTPSGRKFACGGALISDRYVLTAAHCVTGLQPSWKVTGVRFGEYDTRTDIDCLPDGVSDVDCAEEPLNVAVEEIITHSKFEKENPNRPHDIALLRLAEKVSFTEFIKPICLPLVHPIPQRYYTSGWGKNIDKNGTVLKYMSYLTLDRPLACSKKYKSENINISPHQICAGIQSTEKSCIGDEGGPLMGIEERSNYMKRVTAFGVLSMTRPSDGACNDNGWPGVYTKVLHFLPWILNQLKE